MVPTRTRAVLLVLLVLAVTVFVAQLLLRQYFRPKPRGLLYPGELLPEFSTRLPDPRPDLVRYPPNTADKFKVLGLLRGGQYDELETYLESVQNSFEQDWRLEYIVFDTFESFNIVDSTVEPNLHEWQSKYPNSYLPLLAQSIHSWGLGWAARGGSYSYLTSDKQFLSMEAYFDRAKKEAQAALAIRPKLLTAYTVLITIANAAGDDRGMKQAYVKAEKEFPESLILRAIYMSRLAPRWGGSYDEMVDFAVESSKFADRNPNLQVLWGYMYFDLGRTLNEQEQPGKALLYTSKALSYGDYWYYLQERSNEHIQISQYPEALRDLNRLLELRPNLAEGLVFRGSVLWRLHKFEQAMQEFAIVTSMDPADRTLPAWRDHCVETTIYEANVMLKKNPETAMTFYDHAVSLSPGRGESYLSRGVAYYNTGNMGQAKIDLQQSCTLGVETACSKLQELGK